MDLITRLGTESHPTYQKVHEENYARYWSFLQTVIEAEVSLPDKLPRISHDLIRTINLHAIAHLHPEPGLYRTTQTYIVNQNQDGTEQIVFTPPSPEKVPTLMNQLLDTLNTDWFNMSPFLTASMALWRINAIHPFTNGNGRTARAVCYYILCVKAGGLLTGNKNLVEILRTSPHRQRYIAGLREADNGNLANLAQLIREMVEIQLNS